MLKEILNVNLEENTKKSKDSKTSRGRKGFDVGLELGVACRVILGHVKTGKLKTNANDNYALAA